MTHAAIEEIKKAFATLTAHGIWQDRIVQEEQILLNGPSDEPTEELAQKINTFRLKRGLYQELHELGAEYQKELDQ